MAKSYQCIVPGCDREDFQTPWGVRVHCTRSHKELGKWKDEWDDLVKSGEKLEEMPKRRTKTANTAGASTEKYIDGMIRVLQHSPENQLPMRDLMQGLRQNGVTASQSDDALRTRISSIVRDFPDRGITRVERGLYGLARSAQAPPAVDQPGFTIEEVDSNEVTAENHFLRRQNQKKAEAIMGLTRIITSLVSDE